MKMTGVRLIRTGIYGSLGQVVSMRHIEEVRASNTHTNQTLDELKALGGLLYDEEGLVGSIVKIE